jgi:hypothetical protein
MRYQPRMRRSLALAALAVAACASRAAAPRDLTTTSERSGWVKTGRHDETVRLCHDLAAAHPREARCEVFGTTPSGRPMVAVVLGRADLTADAPVLFALAGIHAGEIDGKDAGFAFARDLLTGAVAPGALARIRVVFVPTFNVDGHERFGPNHRPNQRGPEEMGFRTTATGLNLNRDFIKADAPEMRALLALWARWEPTLFVDLHATDGAKFEHDIAVMVAPKAGRGDDLEAAARALQARVLDRMTARGHLPLGFYPSFDEHDDPASGFTDGEAPPRFSHFYAAARDRLGVLVETHSWRPYRERVASTRAVLEELVAALVTDGAAWQRATRTAETTALAGRQVVLLSQGDPARPREIEFRGYAYQRVPSEVSGGLWTQYDETTPAIWRVPLRDQLVAAATVTAPKAGYVIDGGWAAQVAPLLELHGIRWRAVADGARLDAEVWRLPKAELGRTVEGRTTVKVTGAWTREPRVVTRGAIYVPLDQPRARLILHLLEPSAPDALVAWGMWNAAFEQKEYMEGYVAEELARTMLADPAVKAAFDQALTDPAFAASADRRLDWFYRRSPAWDERVGLIPVFRVDAAPPAAP